MKTGTQHHPMAADACTTASSTPSATRPRIRLNNTRAGPCAHLREGRVLQSRRLGQGPPRSQHHRGSRARRQAQARADRGRGDQRQYRHRPCNGLRAEGLSAGRHHGRQLFGRTAQADAHVRRQGGADASRPEGLRHVPQGRRARGGQWLVPRSPVRDGGECRHSRGHDRARDRRRFQGRAARLCRDRLRHWRHCDTGLAASCARSVRRPRSSSPNRPTRN